MPKTWLMERRTHVLIGLQAVYFVLEATNFVSLCVSRSVTGVVSRSVTPEV